MAAIQVLFMYRISVQTTVSVHYRAGVRNSRVSVRRGSTVNTFAAWIYSTAVMYVFNISIFNINIEPILFINGRV